MVELLGSRNPAFANLIYDQASRHASTASPQQLSFLLWAHELCGAGPLTSLAPLAERWAGLTEQQLGSGMRACEVVSAAHWTIRYSAAAALCLST
jgi:hypothetical protein